MVALRRGPLEEGSDAAEEIVGGGGNAGLQ